MEQDKPTRLLYKFIVGVIYTDIELRPRHEIEDFAWKMCLDLGENVNASSLVDNLVRHGIIVKEKNLGEIEYFRHNLPKTLSHAYRPITRTD